VTSFLSSYSFKNKVIVLDYDSLTGDDITFTEILKHQELLKENCPTAIVFIENKKLTMDVSQEELGYPIFTVCERLCRKILLRFHFMYQQN